MLDSHCRSCPSQTFSPVPQLSPHFLPSCTSCPSDAAPMFLVFLPRWPHSGRNAPFSSSAGPWFTPTSLLVLPGNLVSSLSHLLYQGNFFIAVLTSWRYVPSQFISSVSILFGGGGGENVLCLKLDFSVVFFLSFHVV